MSVCSECATLGDAFLIVAYPYVQSMAENYLNHPTFGLLSRICTVDQTRSLFTTLYAHRLFFVITYGGKGVQFEPVSRADAKLMVEHRLRQLRQIPQGLEEQETLHTAYKRTFAQ